MHAITPGLKIDMNLRRDVTTTPRLEIDLNLRRDIVPSLVVKHSKTSRLAFISENINCDEIQKMETIAVRFELC